MFTQYYTPIIALSVKFQGIKTLANLPNLPKFPPQKFLHHTASIFYIINIKYKLFCIGKKGIHHYTMITCTNIMIGLFYIATYTGRLVPLLVPSYWRIWLSSIRVLFVRICDLWPETVSDARPVSGSLKMNTIYTSYCKKTIPMF